MDLYFQDEARVGMMKHIGRYLKAFGVKPIVSYQDSYRTTYLYGSYLPISGIDTTIFEACLKGFSWHGPKEYEIEVVIDNAGGHSTKNIEVPDNIYLLRIPQYNLALNPCKQVWHYIKTRFNNKRFETMKDLRQCLQRMANEIDYGKPSLSRCILCGV